MINQLLTTARLLERGLDIAQLKNQTIAANIAHADTPGYKAQDVPFESMFSELLESAAWKDGSNLTPQVVSRDSSSLRMDGNNVDIDREMTDLAKNQILFEALTFATSRELGRLKLVINEGKG
jgi:flagellar basal-body rod protein FlgB